MRKMHGCLKQAWGNSIGFISVVLDYLVVKPGKRIQAMIKAVKTLRILRDTAEFQFTWSIFLPYPIPYGVEYISGRSTVLSKAFCGGL